MRAVFAGLLALLAGLAVASDAAAQARGGLTPFRSDAELRQFLRRVQGPPLPPPPPPPPPPPVMAPAIPSPSVQAPAAAPSAPPPSAGMADNSAISNIQVTASRIESDSAAEPSITNVQEQGVDEGDIVKRRGDYLIVLRRGRLFTISTAGGTLRQVAMINAYPPGVDARDDWYDEMLVSGSYVVVVGYSYGRGGTEVNRFKLAADGGLTYVDTYQIRSSDYYSDRNYASRLVGNRLVLYAPMPLWYDDDPLEALPAMREWKGQADEDEGFARTTKASDIYISPAMRRRPESIATLHTLTTCNLTAPKLRCDAVGILGPESRSYYASTGAVYLWLADDSRENVYDDVEADSDAADIRAARLPLSMLYRMPYAANEAPGAIGVRGQPFDQFSFREDAGSGALNVLVFSRGGGDAMWRSQFTMGAAALVTIPLSRFGDGTREAPVSSYRRLPGIAADTDTLRNRFAGDYLLYTATIDVTTGEPCPVCDLPADFSATTRLVAAPVRGGQITTIGLPQEATRIELMGQDAVIIGSQGPDLVFSAIALPPVGMGRPTVADTYVSPGAAEAEGRSHGFFYSPDPGSPGGISGLLGLPVERQADGQGDYVDSAAAVMFLRRANRRFSDFGELASRTPERADTGCVVSCVDWYGNSRPIFIGNRVFALMGYELVEGDASGPRIRETGRLNFMPPPARPEK